MIHSRCIQIYYLPIQQEIVHIKFKIILPKWHILKFTYSVELMHAVFSYEPITQLENMYIQTQEKPTEFHDSCVQYCILFYTFHVY